MESPPEVQGFRSFQSIILRAFVAGQKRAQMEANRGPPTGLGLAAARLQVAAGVQLGCRQPLSLLITVGSRS